jgi:uncharacterized protein YdaU (DUF1376 family)
MPGSAAKVDAWMPLWIGDILAETMGLTRDQIGGYMLLLFAYWRNKGPLPDDDEAFAAIVRSTVDDWCQRLRPRLAPFFMLQACSWHHERTEIELAKAGKNKAVAVEKARKAAEGRWRPKSPEHAPSMHVAEPGACVKDTPSPSPSPTVGGKPPTTPGAGAPGRMDSRAEAAKPARAGKPPIEMADRNLALPDWLQPHSEAFTAFEANRWAMHSKAPYTRIAQNGIVSKLEKLLAEGQDLSEVLNASVRNAWRDVFAQRQARRPNQPTGGSFTGKDYNGGELERDFSH